MNAFRIDISADICSFREPRFISAVQPSLKSPGLSTVLGLMNCANGVFKDYKKLKIGYSFTYQSSFFDKETVYQLSNPLIKTYKKNGFVNIKANANVLERECLYKCQLRLYLFDANLVGGFRQPKQSISLGRSQEMAFIDSISEVNLKPVSKLENIKGCIVPYTIEGAYGPVVSLPITFSNQLPRRPLSVKPFCVIDGKDSVGLSKIVLNISGVIDPELDECIYIHDLENYFD